MGENRYRLVWYKTGRLEYYRRVCESGDRLDDSCCRNVVGAARSTESYVRKYKRVYYFIIYNIINDNTTFAGLVYRL